MHLEIQGFKCKKHLHKLTKTKKSAQHSLFINSNHLQQDTQRASSSSQSTAPKALKSFRLQQEITFSSDLPSIPFYMPKLKARAQSPLKSLKRSTLHKTRLHSFTPTHPPHGQGPGNSSKEVISKLVTNSNYQAKDHLRLPEPL